MKIIRAHRLDSLADYAVVQAPAPQAGPGEVRLKVVCAGVGYVDALSAIGGYQVKPPLPNTPGGELAGWVDSVGEGVEALAPGDRIMAMARGAFAEVVAAPAAGVVKIPDAMSFEQAAGFRVNYLTALHGLEDRAALSPGERLLVLGAAGGVGLAAVQIGAVMGA